MVDVTDVLLQRVDPLFAPGGSMTLHAAMEQRGQWLFRYRSHLPLVLAPLFAAAIVNFRGVSVAAVLDPAWQFLCLTVALSGVAIRVATIGFAPAHTSGRNTRRQVADVLNTTGMYSIVRHPLYLGNALSLIGVSVFFRSLWLTAVVTLVFALYYERIIFAEEAFLSHRFDGEFETWADRVPAILPRPSLWRSPTLPFSWRTVVRAEYQGVVAILAMLAASEAFASGVAAGRIVTDPIWVGEVVVGATAFAACRYLKKRTSLLRVPGR